MTTAEAPADRTIPYVAAVNIGTVRPGRDRVESRPDLAGFLGHPTGEVTPQPGR